MVKDALNLFCLINWQKHCHRSTHTTEIHSSPDTFHHLDAGYNHMYKANEHHDTKMLNAT